MRTTLGPAVVGLDGIVQDLTNLVVNARASLPHASNGRPLAPSNHYAANVRREMKQGRSSEFKRLLAVAECDLRDGVPFSEVIAPYRRLIAQLEVVAVAGTLRKPDRPTPTLLRKATKEFSELAVAGLTLVERPSSREATEAVLREAADVAEVLDGIETACERQLAVSRGIQRPQYGQRHTIEVAR